jgi:putative ATP-dependent endonuclease of the OLD family
MRLAEVSVTNFRSIGKAEKFALSDFTVLVGPNNEGKSNLLRALEIGVVYLGAWSRLPEPLARTSTIPHIRLSPFLRDVAAFPGAGRGSRRASERVRYVFEQDFPRNDPKYLSGLGETTIRLTFNLSAQEVQDFRSLTGSTNNGQMPIKLTLSARNVRLEILKPGRGSKVLADKAVEIAKTIVDRLGFFYIPALRTASDVTELVQSLVSKQLTDLTSTDEYLDLQSKLTALRDVAVETVDRSLKASLVAYLPELANVRIETADLSEAFRVRAIHLDDGVETELGQKGDGIKSLAAISLMQQAAESAPSGQSLIFAVEEPEAHLHPDAIHEIKKRLTALSLDRQVIISTHNPVLVNRDSISSNIIVEQNRARPARSVPELRESLGVHLSDNLAHAELLILVEGLTDETALRPLLASKSKRISRALRDGEAAFVPYLGASKLQSKLASLRAAISPWFIVADNDESGRQGIEASVSGGLLAVSDYLLLTTPGMKNSELENLYAPWLTSEALRIVSGSNIADSVISARKKKWSITIEEILTTKGLLSGKDVIDQVKIEAANLAASNPSSAFKSEWSPVLTELQSKLEERLGD